MFLGLSVLYYLYLCQLLLHYIPKANNVLFTPYIFPDTHKYSLHVECLAGKENGPIHTLIKRRCGQPQAWCQRQWFLSHSNSSDTNYTTYGKESWKSNANFAWQWCICMCSCICLIWHTQVSTWCGAFPIKIWQYLRWNIWIIWIIYEYHKECVCAENVTK